MDVRVDISHDNTPSKNSELAQIAPKHSTKAKRPARAGRFA
jgi:hypothetical protein